MNRITGTAQKKSLLRSIWESFKEEWSKSNYWAKFTFIFRAAWALVVLGMQRSITLLVTVILVIGTMIGVAWWLVSGGYNVVLGVILSPIMYVWGIAIMCYAYLLYKYPGKYATIGNRVTGARWIRTLPLWVAGVATSLWLIFRDLNLTTWLVGLETQHVIYLVVLLLISSLLFNEKIRGQAYTISKHPAFFIAIGIAIINWLIWALDGDFWMSIWKTQAKFWAINIASLAAVWLLFIKDESKKTNPVALTFSKIIGGIVGLILVTCIWNFMTSGGDLRIPFFGNKTSVENLSRGVSTVPLEVAKRVVCECETNCQQFEKNKDGNFVLDGEGKKIPTRNKGIPSKGIPPSDAFGKYQFREMHRKPAFDLGFDLNTEEGQDRYFEYLYAKEDFGPWDHDEQFGGGRACWGPKLVALGYNPDGKGSGVPSPRIEEVVAENGEWSPVVNNDRRFEKVRWYPNKKEDCEIRADEDDTKVFGCDQVLDLNAVPKTFSFRHKGKEPMTVEVRFTDPFTR